MGLTFKSGQLAMITNCGRWFAKQERVFGHEVMTEQDTREAAIEQMVAILTMMAGNAPEHGREQAELNDMAKEWRKLGSAEKTTKG